MCMAFIICSSNNAIQNCNDNCVSLIGIAFETDELDVLSQQMQIERNLERKFNLPLFSALIIILFQIELNK